MKRILFSLRGLLLLVTAIGLFLGYSHYRRQAILEVCSELKRDGYAFAVPHELRDYIWQRKPRVGIIVDFNGEEALSTCKLYSDGEETYSTIIDAHEIERMKKTGMVDY